MPHGVTVADPATATSTPTTTTTLAALIAGRVLDGSDRLHYDGANEAVTGVRDPHTPP